MIMESVVEITSAVRKEEYWEAIISSLSCRLYTKHKKDWKTLYLLYFFSLEYLDIFSIVIRMAIDIFPYTNWSLEA